MITARIFEGSRIGEPLMFDDFLDLRVVSAREELLKGIRRVWV